jgi:hypothetical protein
VVVAAITTAADDGKKCPLQQIVAMELERFIPLPPPDAFGGL